MKDISAQPSDPQKQPTVVPALTQAENTKITSPAPTSSQLTEEEKKEIENPDNTAKIEEISGLFDKIGDLNVQLLSVEEGEGSQAEVDHIKNEISDTYRLIQKTAASCIGDECARLSEEIANSLEASGLIVR